VPYPSAIFWRRVGQLTLPLILLLFLSVILSAAGASACAVEGPLCNPLLNFRTRSPTSYGHIANRVPYPSAIFWRRVGQLTLSLILLLFLSVFLSGAPAQSKDPYVIRYSTSAQGHLRDTATSQTGCPTLPPSFGGGWGS